MSCDLLPILNTAAVGAVIGMGGTMLAQLAQGRRDQVKFKAERADRDRRELKEAYRAWFAKLMELTFLAQFANVQMMGAEREGRKAFADQQTVEGISRHLRDTTMVMHGVLMLETDEEARKKVGAFLESVSVVGAMMVTGHLPSFGTL